MTDDPGTVRRIYLGKVRGSHGNSGASIIFSPDGRSLAIATPGNSVALRDITTGEVLRQFGDHEKLKNRWFVPPRPVAFSPDGRRLAGVDIDGAFVVWEIETGTEVFRHAPPLLVGTATFSDTGDLLALGLSGGGLEILDAVTGKSLFLRDGLPGCSDMAMAAFSPGGEWLAISTPVHVELWDLPTMRDSGWSTGRRAVFILPFYRHSPATNMYTRPMIGFSSDASTLAIFAHETITRIDMASIELTHIYRFKFPVISVAYDPEWKRLALLSANGLRIWDIPTHEDDQPH
jgi:WD40 repeat protein